MNEPQLNQNTIMEVTGVMNEVNTLNENVYKKVSKISVEPYHSMDYVAAYVYNGVSQLSSELEKAKGDATKTVAHATSKVMKNFRNCLSQYNAKAAEIVNKLPGNVGVKAGEYPWVSTSFALMAGFLLSGLLKSRRK